MNSIELIMLEVNGRHVGPLLPCSCRATEMGVMKIKSELATLGRYDLLVAVCEYQIGFAFDEIIILQSWCCINYDLLRCAHDKS